MCYTVFGLAALSDQYGSKTASAYSEEWGSRMKKRTILALLLSVAMCFSACDIEDWEDSESSKTEETQIDTSRATKEDTSQESEEESKDPSKDAKSDSSSGDSGFTMSVDGSSGDLSITRAKKKDAPMGNTGSWTIFVYLCGTDLESEDENGMATDDLDQMIQAKGSGNVRFVVQTGGTSEWMNNVVSNKSCERYVIANQNIERVDAVPLRSMGESSTLSDFLTWGVENYPAEKMGVVFWNHGGGSITGVCFDELHDDDSLSLLEINQALSKTYEKMSDRFEFIGFDCCLMGSVESANILATYARYFYGSEEMEPGSGWNYTTIGSYLAENDQADGAALGKVVADSFYAECEAIWQESECTFTVVDLDKFDAFAVAFNDYAKKLYEAASGDLAGVVRGAQSADNFGGNNRSEGYTNMVDVGGIIEKCSSYADGTSALEALKNCIVYNKNGETHAGASGLSIYYPLQVQGSNEIGIFSGVCISPYYLSLVDMVARGYSDQGYSNDAFFDDEGDWVIHNGSNDYFDDSYFDYDYGDEEESELISFAQEPSSTQDGFGFVLSRDSLEYTSSVVAYVFYEVDDETLICLGETDDIYADWDKGEFRDNFDGYWLSLPSGDLLTMFVADWGDDYTVYTSPILLNGEPTNLRVRQYLDYSTVVEGVWDGIDDNGCSDREIRPLKKGDKIEPVYYLDDDSEMYGDSYTWKDGDQLDYAFLPEGVYYYGFEIDDCYGDYFITDCEIFTIDRKGNIYFG